MIFGTFSSMLRDTEDTRDGKYTESICIFAQVGKCKEWNWKMQQKCIDY